MPEPRPFLRVGERQAHATRAGQETPQFLAQFPGEKIRELLIAQRDDRRNIVHNLIIIRHRRSGKHNSLRRRITDRG